MISLCVVFVLWWLFFAVFGVFVGVLPVVCLFECSLVLGVQFAVLAFNEIGEFIHKGSKREGGGVEYIGYATHPLLQHSQGWARGFPCPE